MDDLEAQAVVAAYRKADIDLRVKMSLVGCLLALVLVPAFWGLDLIVYPASANALLVSRLLCGLGVLAVLQCLRGGYGRRWIRFLGMAWALFPGIAISWMVYATEGGGSPYYARGQGQIGRA